MLSVPFPLPSAGLFPGLVYQGKDMEWGLIPSRHQPARICQCDSLHHARGEESDPTASSCSVKDDEVATRAREPPWGLSVSNFKDTNTISETICHSKVIFIQHRQSKYMETKAK